MNNFSGHELLEHNALHKINRLQDKLLHAVTDAGANVKLACRLAGIPNHLFLGHGLHNLVINGGLKKDIRLADVPTTKINENRTSPSLLSPRIAIRDEMVKHCRDVLTSVEIAGEVLEADEQCPVLFEDAGQNDYAGGEDYVGQPKALPT